MPKWFYIVDETIQNIIAWDGESEYLLEEGHTLEPYGDGASIGWQRVGGEWTPPSE